ncbi:MAG TPA: DUF885 domain-containing protein [Bryobacteraceae bacterium]|jgi:uncharacterized protein (DUF885 family)|nr:DUF885 domain-containing protein [Bryobacteraceae bacterium]
MAEDFVDNSLALAPSSATSQGYHEHHGVNLDELLEDYTPNGIARTRVFLNQANANADRIGQTSVSSESRADLDLIRLQCEAGLLDMDRIQSYRHNPTIYVETIGNALYSPFILAYAPEPKRLAQITSRIEKIPAFLETAKQNLISSPAVWTQVAQEEDQGNIGLIDQTIRAKIPADLKRRYDSAAQKALAALRSFDSYLKNDLSQHSYDWRLGAADYAAKFRLTLATGDTVEKTLADAETKLQGIREDMRRQALAVYPRYFPGTKPPQDINSLVSKVLEKVALHHAAPATYFADAKRDLAEATQFVQDHHLLALPPHSNLQVIPTPEFMRGIYGVGGFNPAPAFEPQLGAYYWITPFTPDMSKDRIESKLREYDFDGLKILTLHEAMPGHYVQFQYANEIQPRWRGILRSIYSNGPYVEGWAVYATELMIDSGYQDTPEMRLTFGKQMLRVVSNTLLDIKLQTMGMTDQQAIDLMINDTFQEREEAEKKLQRAKLSSCQLPTYYVGWRSWDQVRDAYRKREGKSFQLAQFHERALKEGAVPMPVLKKLLSQ